MCCPCDRRSKDIALTPRCSPFCLAPWRRRDAQALALRAQEDGQLKKILDSLSLQLPGGWGGGVAGVVGPGGRQEGALGATSQEAAGTVT